jgi:hypothetical protein
MTTREEGKCADATKQTLRSFLNFHLPCCLALLFCSERFRVPIFELGAGKAALNILATPSVKDAKLLVNTCGLLRALGSETSLQTKLPDMDAIKLLCNVKYATAKKQTEKQTEKQRRKKDSANCQIE